MSTQPNILFIITDHHAFYGHDRPGEYDYKWPRFEQFCRQGVRFDRAYSVCPLCTPARASMMTGMYPSRHGLRWNNGMWGEMNEHEFRPGQQLYSHCLSQAGYRNAYIGKWHCGDLRLPADYGIEGWSLTGYGQVYDSPAYLEYAHRLGFPDVHARIERSVDHPEWEGTTQTMRKPTPWETMNCAGVLQGPPEAHDQQFVAHLAIEKLQELASASQPWSLVASFWGPHEPFFPSEPFASMVDPSKIPPYPSFHDDMAGRPLRHILHQEGRFPSTMAWKDWSIWQHVLARCYAQALQLDAAIGQLLDTLDQTGQADNTLVIWCSDHGDAVASHGGSWDKDSSFTEEVARVPMAIRWPARFAGGRRTSALVSNMDATATMLDAAGIATPAEMDSQSMLALAHDDSARRGHLICEHHGHVQLITQRIVVTDRYKYVAALYDGDELYDLQADPFEMRNVVHSPEHKAIKQELRELILAHIAMGRDPYVSELAISLRHGFD